MGRAVLLALDDTDGPSGGCTTHLARELVRALGLRLTGPPRLVRLNPNCPHRTRGNGAVVLPMADAPDLDAVWEFVHAHAAPEARPAVSWTPRALPARLYQDAVRTRVRPERAEYVLASAGGSWRGDPQGLVGCVGASAWQEPPTSYEWIAYRRRAAWGTPRRVAAAPLAALDDAGVTFHSTSGDRAVCAPGTPCPVLLGLRGRDLGALARAAPAAVAAATDEPTDGHLLWTTNQGSGDHVTPGTAWADVPEWGTLGLDAVVAGAPQVARGGVVSVPVAAVDGEGSVVAFEPTKGLRDAVRALRPGDRVVATGAVTDRTLRLERLHVVAAVPEVVSHPVCCGRSMKSHGRGAGYRCASCGAKAPAEAAVLAPRPTGRFEGPPDARRHLHRPVAWDYEAPPHVSHNLE